MLVQFPALRNARVVLAVAVFSLVTVARTEEASQPPSSLPAAGPSGQKAGSLGGRGNAANSPAAEQHQLPPDSTTKQMVALPGRTLAFTATAGLDPPVQR